MKRFNFDELLWFLILLLLDIAITYLLYTDKIKFYIGSNVIKYMYITIVVISIITIFQIKNIFTSVGSNSIKLKLSPIVLALILGVISVTNLNTFRHYELNKDIRENRTSRIDRSSFYEYEFNGNRKNINPTYESNLNKDGKDGAILIDENNPMIVEDIRLNPNNYIGKKIEISGFVCKENYLSENQFIIGKIIMTCCAADSQVVGIIGEYSNASNLVENENIDAVGTINYSMIIDENNISHKIPVISIEKLEEKK